MYDYLFITHLPSFYKVNLYNQLAKRLRIYVVFVASSSAIRTDDFVGKNICFEHKILFGGNFECRPVLFNILKLLIVLLRTKFCKVVVNGWDLLEFWIAILTNKKCRNALVIESTIVESSCTGIKSLLKKYFVSRVGTAFPSGNLHLELLEALGFNGSNYLTRGVGIFNRRIHQRIPHKFTATFLYIGRLSDEKNLKLLVEVFNELPSLKLTIVGSGPLDTDLKRAALANTVFKPHVPNNEIGDIYLSHDIFILPSKSEPWGLVVEEALYYGLPVIVSTNVGCHTELVQEGKTGLKFHPASKSSLMEAVRRAAAPEVYHCMRKQVEMVDFNKRDEEQIMAYIMGCQ